MKAQRIALVLGGILLAVLLYFFGSTSDPKKLGKKDGINQMAPAMAAGVSFEDYEDTRRSALQPSFAAILDNSKEDTSRARIWQQFNSPALAAWYFYKHADKHNDAALLEQAGDLLIAAAKSPVDTAVSNNCFNFALRSFEAARKLAPDNPGLVVKLAETYVDGSPNPMTGITMLMSLGDSLPDFMPAQIALGRFAVVSGQFGKAKERLDKVLQNEPGNTEAMYFLAFAEEGLGNKDKAIALLEQCKILVNNPDFDTEINEYINSIKNK